MAPLTLVVAEPRAHLAPGPNLSAMNEQPYNNNVEHVYRGRLGGMVEKLNRATFDVYSYPINRITASHEDVSTTKTW